MKSNKGITLILVIMTVVLLTIIMGLIIRNGVDTWESSKIIKFKTNIQIIQKKVDFVLEQGKNYTTLGEALTEEQKTKLQTIIDNDATHHYIETNNVEDANLRYFSEEKLKEDFKIEGVQDEFIINFLNREVISLNGIEKDHEIHYVINGL